MGMLQAILDFQLQLGVFRNVDLYMRGFYEIRCGIRCCASPKQASKVEVQMSVAGGASGSQPLREPCMEKARVDPNSVLPSVRCPASSKLFQVQFRDEEVDLYDAFSFKLHVLVDALRPVESLCRTDIVIDFELYFSEEDYSTSLRSRLKVGEDYNC